MGAAVPDACSGPDVALSLSPLAGEGTETQRGSEVPKVTQLVPVCHQYWSGFLPWLALEPRISSPRGQHPRQQAPGFAYADQWKYTLRVQRHPERRHLSRAVWV